jgi:glycogen operon protein
VEFVTPDGQYAREWTIVIDTADPTLADDRVVTAGHNLTVAAHAVVVLQKSA